MQIWFCLQLKTKYRKNIYNIFPLPKEKEKSELLNMPL